MGIVALVLVVDVVCGGLVATGRLEHASTALWAFLVVIAVWFVWKGRPANLACVVLGASPFINLLRNVRFNSGVPLLLLSVVGFWLVSRPQEAASAWRRCRLAFILLCVASVYYAHSFVMTGEYWTNLRVFELACAALLVVMAVGQPVLLSQALWGLLLSAVAMGLASYPSLGTHPEMRLGMLLVEDHMYGNPFALGVPLALGILLLATDRGGWLQLQQHSSIRLLLLVPTFGLLALTTSRAGWLAAAAGLVVGAYLGTRQRLAVLVSVGVLAVTAYVCWDSSLAEPFRLGWERTFREDHSLFRATSSRSEQWVIFWHAWTDNLQRFLLGYGPGSARAVMAHFTSSNIETELAMGTTLTFHSQCMHLGIEWGFLGLVLLAGGLLLTFVKCVRDYQQSRQVLPLSAFAAYCSVILASICFDTVSGCLLGLAFSGGSMFRAFGRQSPPEQTADNRRPHLPRASDLGCGFGL